MPADLFASVFGVSVIQERQPLRGKLLVSVRAKRPDEPVVVPRHAKQQEQEGEGGWSNENNLNVYVCDRLVVLSCMSS